MSWIASERDQFSLGQNQLGKISEKRLVRSATQRFRGKYRCSDMFIRRFATSTRHPNYCFGKAVREVALELTVATGGVVPKVTSS